MDPDLTGPEKPRAERLGEACFSWQDAVEQGRPHDPIKFLERYPDLEEELRSYLSDEGVDIPRLAQFAQKDQTTLVSFLHYQIGQRGGKPWKLGSGGVGAVFRALDKNSRCVVAIKVLRDICEGNETLAQRFLVEAQITAQLAHPGVVPVHAVSPPAAAGPDAPGRHPEGRPYMVMKLVEGHTFHLLLNNKRDKEGRDLPFLLDEKGDYDLEKKVRVFEQVCETVAYAHSRNIVHRDLKSLNVMVGAFGEVQVLDWGMAKRLQPDSGASPLAHLPSAIDTSRTGETVGGGMGTYAYMSREQAMDAGGVDRRADVFSLGAILCEILTESPPYDSTSRDELKAMAREARLGDALGRLAACGADAALLFLARRCLGDLEARPLDAGEIVKELVQRRQRMIEDARRAEIARRRRPLIIASAVAVVLLLLGSGVWLRQRQQRQSKAREDISGAIGKASQLRLDGDAIRQNDPRAAVARYREALAVIEQAEPLASAGGVTGSPRDKLVEEKRQLTSEIAGVERQVRLMGDLRAAGSLAGARLAEFEIDYGIAVDAYREAFRQFGLDVGADVPEKIDTALAELPPTVRDELLASVQLWSLIDQKDRAKLRATLDRIDADPWRCRLRTAMIEADVAALRRLAREARGEKITASGLRILGVALRLGAAADDGVALLRCCAMRPCSTRVMPPCISNWPTPWRSSFRRAEPTYWRATRQRRPSTRRILWLGWARLRL